MPAADRENVWNSFNGRPISRAEAGALREVKLSRGTSKGGNGIKNRVATAGGKYDRRTTPALQYASDISWSTSRETEDSTSLHSADNSISKLSVSSMISQRQHPVGETTLENGRSGSDENTTARLAGEETRDKSHTGSSFEPGSLSTSHNCIRTRPRRVRESRRTKTSDEPGRLSHPDRRTQQDPATPCWDINISVPPSSPPTTPRSEPNLNEDLQGAQGPRSSQCTSIPPVNGVAPFAGVDMGSSAFRLRCEADADDVLRAMIRLSKSIEDPADDPNGCNQPRCKAFLTGGRNGEGGRGTFRGLPSSRAETGKRRRGLSRGNTPAIKIRCRVQDTNVASGSAEVTNALDVEGRMLRSEGEVGVRRPRQRERRARAAARYAIDTDRRRSELSAPLGPALGGVVKRKEFTISESQSAPGLGPRRSGGGHSDAPLNKHLSSSGLARASSSHSVLSTTSRLPSTASFALISDSSSQPIAERRSNKRQRGSSRSGDNRNGSGPDQTQKSEAPSPTIPVVHGAQSTNGNKKKGLAKICNSHRTRNNTVSSVGQTLALDAAETDTTLDDNYGSDSDKTTGEEMSVIIASVTKSVASVISAPEVDGPLPLSEEGQQPPSFVEVVEEMDTAKAIGAQSFPSPTESPAGHVLGSLAMPDDDTSTHGGQGISGASGEQKRCFNPATMGERGNNSSGIEAAAISSAASNSGAETTKLSSTRQHRDGQELAGERKAGQLSRSNGKPIGAETNVESEKLTPPAMPSVLTTSCSRGEEISPVDGEGTLRAVGDEGKDGIGSTQAADVCKSESAVFPTASAVNTGEREGAKGISRDEKESRKIPLKSAQNSEGSPHSQGSVSSQSTKRSIGSSGSRIASKQQAGGKKQSGSRTDQTCGQGASVVESSPISEKFPILGKGARSPGRRSVSQLRLSRAADAKKPRCSVTGKGLDTGDESLPAVGGGGGRGVGRQSRTGAVSKKGDGVVAQEIKVHRRPARVESTDLQTTTEALTTHHLTVDELLKVLRKL